MIQDYSYLGAAQRVQSTSKRDGSRFRSLGCLLLPGSHFVAINRANARFQGVPASGLGFTGGPCLEPISLLSIDSGLVG